MFHENIRQRMTKLNLRGGDLAALANVSAPKLSNFFKGRVELDAAKRKELNEVLSDIEKLKNYFPIPIGVHDPKLLALAIQRLRDGEFQEFAEIMNGTIWDIKQETKESLQRYFFFLFSKKAKNSVTK